MRAIDFRGFRYGNVHTSDLNLEVVSSSNRYEARVLPAPTDVVADIPGSDGQYYFGSTYKNREITCNVAFDSVSEEIYRKIRQLFATDQLQDLVFDEEPYKTWKAKIKSKPEFKSLCFTDKETGQRVYKGDGKLVFICYFPYAFGFDKYVVRAADYYMLNPPEQIICEISNNDDDIFFNTVDAQVPERWLPQDTKFHYNTNPSDYIGGDFGSKTELRDEGHQNRKERTWDPNDKQPWESGFPTPEQVQAGELYFDTEQGTRTIVDVRGYWDNIPEWQGTAKLLTTPTLDFEQELMYMPQYSKVDFINVNYGYHNYRPMIGSRVLVYNPGDLPIDWEIKLDENKRGFWSCRGGERFRIRRFNVERLTIPQAVDWCGLTTYDPKDNDGYKYGNRYFRRRGLSTDAFTDKTYFTIYQLLEKHFPADKIWDKVDYGEDPQIAFNLHLDNWAITNLLDQMLKYDYLRNAHPHHCYYAEPIPRELLGHYIKLFYWQTIYWRGTETKNHDLTNKEAWRDSMPEGFFTDNTKKVIADMEHPFVEFLKQFYQISDNGTIGEEWKNGNEEHDKANNNYNARILMKHLDFEKGIAFANRYEELYKLCITDEERYELYWTTLKDLFTNYIPLLPEGADFEEFFFNYVNIAPEYIGNDGRDLDYENDVFNAFKYPSWMTQDYIEVDAGQLSGVNLIKQYLAAIDEDIDSVFTGRTVYYEPERISAPQYRNLKAKLDRLLNPSDDLNSLLDDAYFLNTETRMLYATENPYGMEFMYKPTKNIMNEAITKGKWFKLPPGWSLLCIEPVVDDTLWGGKRWLEARPYFWGYGGDRLGNKREVQQLYDYVYDRAQKRFLEFNDMYDEEGNIVANMMPAANKPSENLDADTALRFRVWYEDKITDAINNGNQFYYWYYRKKQQDAEYQFLKTIDEMWQLISPYWNWTAGKGVSVDPDNIDKSALEYDVNGNLLRCINGNISDWWWYACNYIWANFPPVYWATADLLNSLQIKYTPLFY